MGRGQEWHEGDAGSPGKKIFQKKIFDIFIFQKTADLTYSNEIPTSVYNPSGMYGLKAMGVSFCFSTYIYSSPEVQTWQYSAQIGDFDISK